MDLQIFALLVQDGITNGAVYALLALALVLVFAVTRVIWIPSGEFVAYGTLTLAGLQAGEEGVGGVDVVDHDVGGFYFVFELIPVAAEFGIRGFGGVGDFPLAENLDQEAVLLGDDGAGQVFAAEITLADGLGCFNQSHAVELCWSHEIPPV